MNQPKRSPISISSSYSFGGGGGGASFLASTGLAAGLSAFFSAAGVDAAGAGPADDPKKSVTFFPFNALATALTRVGLTVTLAAASTALSESAVTSAPAPDRMKAA
jgi:hypothetical protein